MKEYELLKQYKDVLTPVELKEILGIGMNGVYSLLKSGKITSFKVGSQFRITKSSKMENNNFTSTAYWSYINECYRWAVFINLRDMKGDFGNEYRNQTHRYYK